MSIVCLPAHCRRDGKFFAEGRVPHATVATKLFCHSKSLYRLKQGSEPMRGLIHVVRGAKSKMIWVAILAFLFECLGLASSPCVSA